MLLGDRALHRQLEAAPLAHAGELVEAEPGQAGHHGLALRVQDLGLGHNLDEWRS